MPIQVFTCQGCAYRFEVYCQVGTTAKPCPKCKNSVEQGLPRNIQVSFKASGNEIHPENTGVADLDYVADRAIGENAAKGYQEVEKREEYKRKLLRDSPGATKQDLIKLPDGDYMVIPHTTALGLREKVQGLTDLLWEEREPLKPL